MSSQTRFLFVLLFALSMAATRATHGQTLQLGETDARVGGIAEVPLTLSSTEPVAGLVAAFEWDEATLRGAGLDIGPALADAETVAVRVEDDYAVLGVVVDSDGVGIEAIPAGSGLLLATVELRCTGSVGRTTVSFADGKYATTDDGPLLDNLVVVGGEAIDASNGLDLVDGSVDCNEAIDRFFIGPSAAGSAGTTEVSVLMENGDPIEGYTIALCHAPSLTRLVTVEPGRAALDASAEFVDAEVLDEGGTLAVILDLEPPFDGQVIPPGDTGEIGVFAYECLPPGGGEQSSRSIQFCDETLGTPPLSNVTVLGGEAVLPRLENGVFECSAPPCDDCLRPPAFACGPSDRFEPDGMTTVEAAVGNSAEVCFFLKTQQSAGPGSPFPPSVQGFSMALTFDCRLEAIPALDMSGTILEAVGGAEFVEVLVDNDSDGADERLGCEIVIAVLVDALPPFDNAAIPAIEGFQRMGCVEFAIDDDPGLCGDTLPIEFENGLLAGGGVPISNTLAIANESVKPEELHDSAVVPVRRGTFYRGDCDFSGGSGGEGLKLNINDAGALISMLFHPEATKFIAPCDDACDCNDDGRLDLADTMCILQFLFRAGPVPPAPGPGVRYEGGEFLPTSPGIDPTVDLLECDAGSRCF